MLYFLNYDGIGCSVFQSQILTLLTLLKRTGMELCLINFEKKSELTKLTDQAHDCEQELGAPVLVLPKGDHCNFFIAFHYIKRLCRLLKSRSVAGQPVILHARGCFAGYIAIQARRRLREELDIKVVTDFRGLISAEYRLNFARHNGVFRGLARLLSGYVARLEKYTAVRSDALLCVSRRFKSYICNQFGVDPTKVTIIPTCIDLERFRFAENARIRLRAAFGWENCFVVVYCGGAQSWQSPDLLFQAFLQIRQRIQTAKLLLLSNEAALFEKLASDYRLPKLDYRIVRAPFDEVNQYLSMADCALLLRKADPVNEVACPTKFAEYLCCRLPVVANRNVGDFSDIIEHCGVGIFDDELDQIQAKISQINPDNCFQVVNDTFSWEVNLEKLTRTYRACVSNEI